MVILLLKISVYCSNVPACWKTKRELRHRLRSPRNAETLIQTRELRGFSDGVHSNRHSNKRKWCILTIISGKNWIRLQLTITSRRSYTSTWARIMKYTLFLLKIYNLMQKLWHRCMTKKNAGGRISETNTANSEAVAQWFTESSKTFIIIVFYVSWMRLWDVSGANIDAQHSDPTLMYMQNEGIAPTILSPSAHIHRSSVAFVGSLPPTSPSSSPPLCALAISTN